MTKLIRANELLRKKGLVLFHYLSLTSNADVRAAEEVSRIRDYLAFEVTVLLEQGTEFYFAGPFLSKENARKAQNLIEARSNQIEKCVERDLPVPHFWKVFWEKKKKEGF